LSWGQGLHLPDRLFRLLCQGAALFVLALLVALVGFLVAAAWPAISRFGFGFLVSQDWDPQHDHFGALTFVWGTIVTSALAMLLAVPLGIGAAAYLAEIAPGWTRRTGSFLIELLAAIPSVVYGFWGLYFLRPALRILFAKLDAPLYALAKTPGLGWLYNSNASGNGILT